MGASVPVHGRRCGASLDRVKQESTCPIKRKTQVTRPLTSSISFIAVPLSVYTNFCHHSASWCIFVHRKNMHAGQRILLQGGCRYSPAIIIRRNSSKQILPSPSVCLSHHLLHLPATQLLGDGCHHLLQLGRCKLRDTPALSTSPPNTRPSTSAGV